VPFFVEESGSGIFWSPECNPLVLSAEATPIGPEQADAFDIRQFEHLAEVLRCDGCEHILFSDGLRHLQLAVTMGTVLDGPVCLRYALSGFRGVEAKVLTLRRFCHLCRVRRFPKTLYQPERRAPRWMMLLRAWDGMRAGASQRVSSDIQNRPLGDIRN
jgi:hypothetical protein